MIEVKYENMDEILKRIKYLQLFEWSRTEQEDNELKELIALYVDKFAITINEIED